jgi:hypothetical protein
VPGKKEMDMNRTIMKLSICAGLVLLVLTGCVITPDITAIIGNVNLYSGAPAGTHFGVLVLGRDSTFDEQNPNPGTLDIIERYTGEFLGDVTAGTYFFTANYAITDVPAGNYYLLAFLDFDEDGRFEAGEPFGFFDPNYNLYSQQVSYILAESAIVTITAGTLVNADIWLEGITPPA